MQYIDNIIFLILLVTGFGLFAKSLLKIYRNIRLGHEINRNDRKGERWGVRDSRCEISGCGCKYRNSGMKIN